MVARVLLRYSGLYTVHFLYDCLGVPGKCLSGYLLAQVKCVHIMAYTLSFFFLAARQKLLVVWVSLDGCWGFWVVTVELLYDCYCVLNSFSVFLFGWQGVLGGGCLLAQVGSHYDWYFVFTHSIVQQTKNLKGYQGFAMWLLVCSGWLPRCFYVVEGVLGVSLAQVKNVHTMISFFYPYYNLPDNFLWF